jgi:formiminotetrahydrofolate cyclodeaminase
MASKSSGGGASVMALLTSKSLSSMVKGIRAHKTEHAGNANAEAEYIAKCMAEIKTELQVR